MIAGTADPRDPRLSPLYAGYRGCPPVLLQCSDSEILYDDARRMAERLREFDAPVTLDVLAQAPHVWQLFDRLLPEARVSLGESAGFIAAALRAPRPGGS